MSWSSTSTCLAARGGARPHLFCAPLIDAARDLAVPVYVDGSWTHAYHGGRVVDADGIIVNTAAELERGAFSAIADGRCTRARGNPAPPPLYAIGPVISSPQAPAASASSAAHPCVPSSASGATCSLRRRRRTMSPMA